MMKTKALPVHRCLVRQRQPCHRVATPLKSCLRQHDWFIFISKQQFTFRTLGVVAANITDTQPLQAINASSNLPQTIKRDDRDSNFPVKFIDFTAASKIEGEESHIATITLQPGETLCTESGSLIYMTEGVTSKYFDLFITHHSCTSSKAD
jgi:Mitochondrial biogenesis AIM24